MRTFVSMEILEYVKKEIVKIQNKLPEFYGKKTESKNLHLTLKFLGEIDGRKIKKVKEKLKEIEYNSFDAEIDFLGVFDNRKSEIYKKRMVTWLHVKNCKGLQKKVDDSLEGLFEKENRFMSHLTIARVKNIEDKKRFLKELKKIEVPIIKFNVKCFYLINSRLSEKGPKYSVIEKYILK